MLRSLLLPLCRRHFHIVALNSVRVKLWDAYLSRTVAKDGKDVYASCSEMYANRPGRGEASCGPDSCGIVTRQGSGRSARRMRPDSYGLQCETIMCGGRMHSGEAKMAPARTLEGGRGVISPGGSFCAETCAACAREDAGNYVRRSAACGGSAHDAHGGIRRCGVHSRRDSVRAGVGTRCLSYTRLLAVCGEDAGGETCARRPKSSSAGTAPQSGRLCAFGDAGDGVLRAGGMHTALWTANARRRAPTCWRTTRGCVVLPRTRRLMRTEMGNDARRPLLAHPTHNSSELTRAGVRVAVDAGSGRVTVEAEWRSRGPHVPDLCGVRGVVTRADGRRTHFGTRVLSNSSIAGSRVAEWREKAGRAGRGIWVRAGADADARM
ncbi:hypothetical protein C8R44DRAFT_958122 [Mycena epipterygia]|nr:hypothetical protein C8R44DRAFT_958122 [Mycena epipterygia]